MSETSDRLKRVHICISKSLVLCILVCYTAYASVFIYRTSFVINEERYFSLFDDAMVGMRFGKNFSEGHGFVWNVGGERVEGFTNPLWVLWMGILHLLPIAQSKMSLLVQITSLIALAVNLIFVRKIAALLTENNPIVTYGAMILTAAYLPLNNWSLQGLEVGASTMILNIAIWIALNSMKKRTFNNWLYIALGIGTLIRFDIVVPALGIIGFLWLTDKQNRWKHAYVGVMIVGGFMMAQTALRFWYYRELLPNTYYQKMTGFPIQPRIFRGAFVYWHFFVYPLRPLLLFLAVFLLLHKWNRCVLLLLWTFLGQTLYSIYVGGDAWEFWGGSNRYIVITMPVFFILLALAFTTLFEKLSFAIPKPLTRAISMMVIVASLFLLNNIGEEKGDGIKEFLLIKKPLYVEVNKKTVEEALYLRSITKPEAKIAIVWAGALAYFADRNMIDLLGKNDKVIARKEWTINKNIAFHPGHVKWDYAYSIGVLKPDIVSQLWLEPETAQPFLDAEYRRFNHNDFTHYLRNNSSAILLQH